MAKMNWREREDEDVDDNGWAVSYGDLMSLLLAFFVTLLSISTVNTAKYEEVKKYLKGDRPMTNDFEALEAEIKAKVKAAGLQNEVEVDRDESGVYIILRDFFFESGEAKMRTQGLKLLDDLLDSLKGLDEKYVFDIEGHTDDTPIASPLFPSNWHLSTARALNVLNLFIKKGIKEKRLSVQGFGSQKPIVKNRYPNGRPNLKNMAKNRRVIIKVR